VKRGLVVLDPAETSAAVFAARVNALRARLDGSGAAVALIYGDVSRSGDIQYLTNLCLYWNEAILAVAPQSKPVLITKLSKRVQPWMRRTSILEDIRSGPRLVEGVGKLLDERAGGRAGRIALVELSWWPNNLVAALRAALPQAELTDLRAVVRDMRLMPSAEEMELLRRGARLLDGAMRQSWAQSADAHERTSVAVRYIRRAGFLDATVSCGKLKDGSEFADAIGQYRYVWLRQSWPRGGPLANAASGTLRATLDAATPGATEAQLAQLAASRAGDQYRPVLSCMAHSDIETRGLFRVHEERERQLQEGEVVCVTLSLAGEAGVLAAAETVEITRTGAVPLFGQESS
jgi:hypothetical protein